MIILEAVEAIQSKLQKVIVNCMMTARIWASIMIMTATTKLQVRNMIDISIRFLTLRYSILSISYMLKIYIIIHLYAITMTFVLFFSLLVASKTDRSYPNGRNNNTSSKFSCI